MYCKVCGNLLSNDDTMCNACGSEVIMDTKPETKSQEKVTPEVIFNPPFDPFAKKDDDESEGKKGGRIGRPDTGEFSWNVYDFPKSSKPEPLQTDTTEFNWSSEEVTAQDDEEQIKIEEESSIQAPDLFEPEAPSDFIIEDISEDKFKTKNLTDLDQLGSVKEDKRFADTIELEKNSFIKDFENVMFKKDEPKEEIKEDVLEEINILDLMRSSDETEIIPEPAKFTATEPVIDSFVEQIKEPIFASIIEDEEIITKSDLEKATHDQFSDKGIDVTSSDKEKFFTFSKKNEEFQRLLDKEYARINGIEEVPEEPTPVPTPVTAAEPETITPPVAKPEPVLFKPTPIEEMRPINIQSDIEQPTVIMSNKSEVKVALDNEPVKPKYNTLEVMRNDLKTEKSLATDESAKKGLEQKDYSYFDSTHSEEDNDYEEEQGKSGIFAKVVLVVIILLLIAELTILGIKYFMPDSQATAFIQDKEILIVENVTEWIDNIKNMFAK